MTDYRAVPLLRKFGISPELIAPVIVIDSLLFTGEFFSGGVSLFISIPVGICVGLFAVIWQRKKYKDSLFRAILKGAVVGVLTAIPTPLTSLVTIIAGTLPLFDKNTPETTTGEHIGNHQKRREEERKIIDAEPFDDKEDGR